MKKLKVVRKGTGGGMGGRKRNDRHENPDREEERMKGDKIE